MMNSQTLFPRIGKVIANTGKRNFSRLLHDLILTKLPVDATHITQLRVKSSALSSEGANDASVEWVSPACMDSLIGSNFMKTPPLLVDADERAIHRRLTDFSSDVPDRRPVEFNSQLHLTSRKDEYCYIISVYREQQANDFSAQEQLMLKDFSSLLLPLVEKHINAISPQTRINKNLSADLLVPENRDIHTLRQRFEDRLAQSGLHLSTREKQICTGLLSGRTAPELAEALSLKVNTVESYLKRAVIKMGISGRHSLIRWMHAAPGTPSLMTASAQPDRRVH